MAEPRDGALAKSIAATLRPMSVADALAALRGVDVRAVPAQEGEEVLADKWLQANNFLDQQRQTPYGLVTNRPYATFSRSPCGYSRPDPGLGEHSFEILADYGIDPGRIERLADDGVVMVLC
jgi:crotonobetainyl-CoA:carnitine CoA-transferase CaiB-like acyl-CoA transferase